MVTLLYMITFIAALIMLISLLVRNKRIDTRFITISLLVCVNTGATYLISISPDLDMAIAANQILYVGSVYSPILLTFTITKLCGLKLPKLVKHLTIAAGTMLLGLVFTIKYNKLYYTDVKLRYSGDHYYLEKLYGPAHKLYILFMAYLAVMMLVCCIYAFRRRKEISYMNVTMISLTGCTVIGCYIIEKLIDTDIELLSISYLAASFFLQKLFTRFNMYDMNANVFLSAERLNEYGFIELDSKNRYVAANDYIKNLFPEITENWQVDAQIPDASTYLYDEVICWALRNESGTKTIHVADRYLDVSAKDIPYNRKKSVGCLIEFIDHTEEHRYTSMVEQSRAEAIKANEAKSSFLAQMSHEIRTPINAILGMNEMILRESKEQQTLEYASNAYNSGKALLSIINDILDISKIEAGKLKLSEGEYDLYSLISDCYHMVADRAAKRGLQFNLSVDETLPSKLYGDMFHLRQIIVNFLTNAVKYTDVGFVDLIFTGVRSDEGFSLKVCVRDSGIGLTEDSLSKLFTTFQRFDLKRNQSVEGTGLGLSICKQLADLMNGTIEAESTYGKGSSFTCIIPQKIISEQPVGKISPDNIAEPESSETYKVFTTKDAHILVVDDVEMNLIVFTSLLKGHELQIDTARSGKESLELINKKKYDIIFMDHMMPEMDGIETLHIMKNSEHLNNDTPVIMLTANAIMGQKEKYLSEGFAAYLTKPIRSKQLDNVILHYLPEDKITIREAPPNTEADPHKAEPDMSVHDNGLIDFRLGLSYSDGNEAMYRDIMKIYVKSGKEKADKLVSLCRENLWKDYTTEVHSLKSTSLTVGAKKLSELAKELEFAGKNGDYDLISARNPDMIELYTRVLEEGQRYLDALPDEDTPEPDNPLTEISIPRLTEIIEGIKTACLECDGDAADKICREASVFSLNGTPLKPCLDEIRALANDFEYDAAIEKADEIIDRK
ncbi:MAG: ATP-binding protein [Huintestinicola sp.]